MGTRESISDRGRDRDDDDRGRGRDRDDDSRDSRRGRDSRDDDRGSRRGRDDDDRPSSRGRDHDDDDKSSRRGRSGYVYEPRSAESARRQAAKGGKDYDNFLDDIAERFTAQDGDNTIRILPPTWEGKKEHYGYEVWVHFGVGPDNKAFLCLHKHKGEKCPVCEERERALDDGDEEYAKKIEAKRRTLIYLLDREDRKGGIKVWAMPWTLDRDIIGLSVDKKTGEPYPLDHPDRGYDVEFTKEGSKERTKYTRAAIARRESELGNDRAMDFALEHPLPDLLVFYSYEHIAKEFGGGNTQRGRDYGRADRDDDRSDRDSGRGRDDRRERDEGYRNGPERSSRSRDDEEDGRSNRSRDSSDDAADNRSHSSGRSRDSDRGRGDRSDEPALTFESIHEMSRKELEAIIEDKGLKINPDRADNVEELADWICEDLELKKTTRRSRGDEEQDAISRLAEMRRNRGN